MLFFLQGDDCVKKILKGIATALIIIICVPILFCVLIGMFLYTPIDYVVYKTSTFFREYREKYTWLFTLGTTYKWEKAARQAGLPITYIGRGWFVCGDTLLSQLELGYDGGWCITESGRDVSDVPGAVDAEIEECRNFKPDLQIRRIILLWNDDGEEFTEPLPTGYNFSVMNYEHGESEEDFLRRFVAESERLRHENT